MAIVCLGFSGFISTQFWLSLYLQRIKHLSALEVAVRLLPMVINGILVNIVTGLVLHRVRNNLLMAIGAVAYVACSLILGFMKEDASYWTFIFPALLLSVVGADIQFNVANVCIPSYLRFVPWGAKEEEEEEQAKMDIYWFFSLITDVCDVLPRSLATIPRRWNLQHHDETLHEHQPGNLHRCVQLRGEPDEWRKHRQHIPSRR
jgi:hypothetical protein